MAYTDAELASFLAQCRGANRTQKQAISGASEQNLKCTPKTVNSAQMAQLEQTSREQRTELERGGWRASAQWLERNFPEEYREPRNGESSSEFSNQTPTADPQRLMVPAAPLSTSAALSAPLPIPPELPGSWWQALLYGSRDAMLSPVDANTALRLVGRELAKDLDVVDFTESVQVNALRKTMDQCFGATAAWQAINKLWRAAPSSPDAPQPGKDESKESPGSLPASRNQPQWIRELNEPDGAERSWLIENGLWCG
jgi:hypothetical protein